MRNSNAVKKTEIEPAGDAAPCESTRAAQDFANSPGMQILRKLAGGEPAKIRAADADVTARAKSR